MRLNRLAFLITTLLFLCNSLEAQTIQDRIDAALDKKTASVTIPPGTYNESLSNRHGKRDYIRLEGVSNFTVYAKNVTLKCTTLSRAITLKACNNVAIRGLIIDYDPVPFTQGEVLQLAPMKNEHFGYPWMDVQLDEGYPEPTWHEADRGLIHDPLTGNVKDRCTYPNFERIEQLRNRVYCFHHKSYAGIRGVAPGDLLSVYNRSSMAWNTIGVDNCEFCLFEDVTLLSANSGWIISDRGSTATTYRRVKIIPGPKPPGATRPRLRAGHADGIHAMNSPIGPTIEACVMDGLGDDFVAIRGSFSFVLEDSTTQSVHLASGAPPAIGETVQFNLRHIGQVETRIIQAIEPSPLSSEEIVSRHGNDLPYIKSFKGYTITLDKPIAALRALDLMVRPAANGHHFKVIGNHFRNTRARGIILKASQGVIKDNRIEYTALPGLLCTPEWTHFLEADFVRNVTIQGNHFHACNRGLESKTNLSRTGVLCLTRVKDWKSAQGHRSINIIDNIFENCYGLPIQINSVSNVIITRNQFKKTHYVPTVNGENQGLRNDALISIDYAQDVEISTNVYHDLDPEAAQNPDGFVHSTENSKNIMVKPNAFRPYRRVGALPTLSQ